MDSRRGKAVQVALVESDDMSMVRCFSECVLIFVGQRFGSVDDDDQKIRVRGLASGAVNTDSLNLISGDSQSRCVCDQNRDSVEAERFGDGISSSARNVM